MAMREPTPAHARIQQLLDYSESLQLKSAFAIANMDRLASRISGLLEDSRRLCSSTPSARTAVAAPFEVVSIKRHRTPATASSGTNKMPTPLNLVDVTLLSVIHRAFGVVGPQIIGAPDWLFRERYDIVGMTADGDELSADCHRAYLQSVLDDRCQFLFHRETRRMPTYSLRQSMNGPKLAVSDGSGEYGMRVRPTDEGGRRLRSTGNMAQLVEVLTGEVGEVVADRTGATGEYDFTLEWMPDADDGDSGPSLFTALTQQLGLRLVAANCLVQAIVIDRIERPIEN
jgi:uncharacterized protein (TIGR03435 family)